MLLQKMRALLFLIFIGFGIVGCDSFVTDSEEVILEDANKDIVPPTVESFFPENESTDIEVDSVIRLTFSELMNIDVLENKSDLTSEDRELSAGIVLYSGKPFGGIELRREDERPRTVEYLETLGVGVDPVTNNNIDIDVTTLILRHETGRFALNAEYTVFVSEDVIDLADDLKTKFVVEGNKLGKNIELIFETEEGEWKENSVLALSQETAIKGQPALLEGDQLEPILSSNSAGVVYAVWKQRGEGGVNDSSGVWVSRYRADHQDWGLNAEAANEAGFCAEFAPLGLVQSQ
mgnify:CR=1 FL=1